MDNPQIIRERAAAASEHVARDQPLYFLFRHSWTDLENRSKNGKKEYS